jgi:GNAT superfamily N-acetyltransferase
MSDERAEPSGVRLRAMAKTDVPDILPLLSQLGYEISQAGVEARVDGVLTEPRHCLLVAERGRRIVGLMHVFARPAIENPREAVVQALVVDEGCRRTGVGRMLTAAAERWGADHGCRSVMLESNIARLPAHRFYAALGYRVAATAHILRKALPQQ